MNNQKVTSTLIRRYIAGETNLEETALILKASKEDKYLRGYLDLAFELNESLMYKNDDVNPPVKISFGDLTHDSLVKIPMGLAAECDRDNLCSLKCELYLLSKFNKDEGLTETSLLSEAKQLGILKD